MAAQQERFRPDGQWGKDPGSQARKEPSKDLASRRPEQRCSVSSSDPNTLQVLLGSPQRLSV